MAAARQLQRVLGLAPGGEDLIFRALWSWKNLLMMTDQLKSETTASMTMVIAPSVLTCLNEKLMALARM